MTPGFGSIAMTAVIALFAPRAVAATSPTSSLSAASPRIYVVPAHDLPSWDATAPTLSGPITMANAVSMLLPREVSGMPVTIDRDLITRTVSWPAGLTRRAALMHIVPEGYALLVFDSSIVLAAGRVSEPSPARASNAVRLATVAPAPGASMPGAASVPTLAVAAIATQSERFRVSPTDRTLRNVVARWSVEASWSFDNSFWTLPRDLPVKAADVFTSDFKSSVLSLLRSTEVTDLPAKPCFYTNHVVRIVAKAEKCDRTKE